MKEEEAKRGKSVERYKQYATSPTFGQQRRESAVKKSPLLISDESELQTSLADEVRRSH